jgi:hypothetical protein
MSHALFIPKEDAFVTDHPSKAPETLVALGNWILFLSVAGFLFSIAGGYTHADFFSFEIQVFSHILMMLCAGTIKLGYVIRLNGLRQSALSTPNTRSGT